MRGREGGGVGGLRKRVKYSERLCEWTKEREWQSAPRAQLRLMVMKIRRNQ